MIPKNIDRRLLTILAIVFVQMVGSAMILPILPLFAKREFSLSPQAIALLVTAFFGAQFLAGPFLGRLSDVYGRLPLLIISQIGTAVSFLMLALAPNAETLFLARILDGITGGNIIVAQAYITDITPREKRTESLGYIFAVFGIGFIIGPAAGGILAASFGARAPYMIAAAVATAVVILTWVTLQESVSQEQRLANRRRRSASMSPRAIAVNRPLMLILLVAFLGQFSLGLLQATFALFGEAILFKGYDENATNMGIGLLLAGIGLGQFITQAFLLRPALARYSEAVLVVVGVTFRMLTSLAYAVIVSPWLAAPNGMFFAFGIGIMMPSLQSLSTSTVEDEIRGGVLGVYQSVLNLSIVISTALGGVLYSFSPRIPYLVGGILAGLALPPAFVLLSRSRGQWATIESATPTTG